MKRLFLSLLIIIIIITILTKAETENVLASGDPVLFLDVTNSNLPVAAVSGPGMDVGSADFDGDGDPDVVIAREYAPNVLLLNEGNGVFINGTAGRLPQFNYDSEDIGIADFNQDGFPDIVFASEDNAVHEFYLNDGHAVFTNFNNRLPASITNGLLVTDLNNDNYPDLIFGNSAPGNPAVPTQARVLINNKDTTFRDETSIRFPADLLMVPQDIKEGDLDGDGDKDLIFGNETGNRLLINNGSGIFTNETDARLPLTGTEETRKVTLGDIDKDGDLDVFFANVVFRTGMLSQDRILINNGSGYFADETAASIPVDNEHTMEGIFLDVDYDGDDDLITSNVFVNRPVKLFINDGAGFFEERTNEYLPPGVVAEGLGIEPADFNNDGLKDLYVVHRRTAQSLGNDKLLIRKDTTTVGINFNNNISPDNFELKQNYPNPFNPVTVISYSLIENRFTTLKVYDAMGNEVASLINEAQSAGNYSVNWDAVNHPSGIYFCKLTSGNYEQVKTMILLK
ncbi:MAG: T9SS type A sorting domain-containing protein [Ignavibacteria bacterium]|nr:T9SS type A sorting domain-containing protein [Ignavibacteria bacterium]